jgi:hypothetical protein
MMAVTQIRQPDTVGRRYYERKRLEGKTTKEAMRCLKRRLSDVVYWQLIADRRATIAACAAATTPTRTPFYIHLGRETGAARRTTTQAATPDGVDPRREPPAQPRTPRRGGHRDLIRQPRPPRRLFPTGAPNRRPQPGSRLAQPPEGLGLDPGEDDDTIPPREQPHLNT